MNRAFKKLGYHENKDGSIEPIILQGKPKPAAIAPLAPEKPKREDYFEMRERLNQLNSKEMDK